MITILTSEKDQLIECHNICLDNYRGFVNINEVYRGSTTVLGVYATEERALEILLEILTKIENSYYNAPVTYRMPYDEDIEISNNEERNRNEERNGFDTIRLNVPIIDTGRTAGIGWHQGHVVGDIGPIGNIGTTWLGDGSITTTAATLNYQNWVDEHRIQDPLETRDRYRAAQDAINLRDSLHEAVDLEQQWQNMTIDGTIDTTNSNIRALTSPVDSLADLTESDYPITMTLRRTRANAIENVQETSNVL